MQAEQDKVIMIKDDEEEDQCNNRIFYLRAQRLCERNARQCRECCEACENHGDERLKKEHVRIQVQKFINSFQNLQASCSRQTEHYIRQMNDAQRKAIQQIGRKKEEYLKQIEEVKAHMMKKTYRTLEEKYNNLYQKYKNDRLDLLKCCEVFWVMNALPSSHPLKHSEINKKLEGILRKFESFKQVSRNLPTENMFNNKEKVKKAKISQKIGAPQVRKEPVHLQKVNYDNQQLEAYRRRMNELSAQLNELKNQKIQRQKQLNQLEIQIRNRIRKLDILKPKLSFQSKTINFKYPEISESQGFFQQFFRKNNCQNPKKTQQKSLSPQRPKENKFMEMLNFVKTSGIQINNNSLQKKRSDNLQKDKRPDYQKMINQDQNNQLKEKPKDVIENQQQPAIVPEQNELKQNIPSAPQNLMEVKLQPVEEPFVQWQNTELIQDMRKYGKNVSQGLKVQEIDRMRSFNYVKAPQLSIKINSSLLKKPQSLAKNDRLSTPEKKVTDFTILASSLFQKHEMKKLIQADKQQRTEKTQKKPETDKKADI